MITIVFYVVGIVLAIVVLDALTRALSYAAARAIEGVIAIGSLLGMIGVLYVLWTIVHS